MKRTEVDRPCGGSPTNQREGGSEACGRVAHCYGGGTTRVPRRPVPTAATGETETDSPPVLTVIYDFANPIDPTKTLPKT